eukprot:4789979-Pyramimonas_sp.AAC.1
MAHEQAKENSHIEPRRASTQRKCHEIQPASASVSLRGGRGGARGRTRRRGNGSVRIISCGPNGHLYN